MLNQRFVPHWTIPVKPIACVTANPIFSPETPVSMSIKKKMMDAVNIRHKISKLRPNTALVDTAIYQQAECMSWWLSNSFVNISSTLYARTVDKPLKVADKWVNAGDFAVKETNQWRKYYFSANEVLYGKLFHVEMISHIPIPSNRFTFLDVFK